MFCEKEALVVSFSLRRNGMLLAGITIIVSICFIAVFTFMDKPKERTVKQMSVQNLINVADIKGHVLYTNDNQCIAYVRLQPPMLSLWTDSEKKMKTNVLMAEISKIRTDWMLNAVSRPLDVSQLINSYQDMRDATDDLNRKKVLKQEMHELQKKVGTGEAVERQFYLKFWTNNSEDAEQELYERGKQFISAFEAIGVVSELLKEGDIIRFCNLVHNPAYISEEDLDIIPTLPMILDGGIA